MGKALGVDECVTEASLTSSSEFPSGQSGSVEVNGWVECNVLAVIPAF